MYVVLEEASPYGISDLGFCFSDNSIDTIKYRYSPLTYLIPQVKNPVSTIITDTLNWSLITGTFVATGNEKYLVIGNFETNAATTTSLVGADPTYTWSEYFVDDISCIDIDLPAYAGPDLTCIPGNSVYIGRPQDVGIDEACMWYQLPNTTNAIDTAAGTVVWPVQTTTYVVRQEICAGIKWDTVVVYQDAVGIENRMPTNRDWKFSPNPAGDQVIIFGSKNQENLQLIIYDISGQQVLNQSIIIANYQASLKHNLINGVYFVSVVDQNNQRSVKKLVIAK